MRSCIALRRVVSVVSVVGVFLALPLAVHAKDERIVSTPAELVDALRDMATNTAVNVITLREGYYDLSTITPMKDTHWLYADHTVNDGPVIRGDPAVTRDKVVLDGKGEKGILWLFFGRSGGGESFSVKNITFRNGKSTDAGGAIKTEKWGILKVTGCDFYCNKAANNGGAVGGDMPHHFSDCHFATNSIYSGYGQGGAVKATRLVSCTFVANKTTGSSEGAPAALLSKDAWNNAYATNCLFADNRMAGAWGYWNGGALQVNTGANATIVDCVFTNNAVVNTQEANAGAGGALGCESTTKVIGCRFYDNYVDVNMRWGGAIAGTAKLIQDCYFSGNYVTGNGNGGFGGAIGKSNGLITNCTFIANEACYGGAIYSCTNVRNCRIVGNKAMHNSGLIGGGAAYDSTIYGCVVTNNYGIYKSGALYNCKAYGSYFRDNFSGHVDTVQESEKSSFVDCVLAGHGDGGQHQQYFSNCSFANSVVTNFNTLYLFQNVTYLTNTLVYGNTAYVMCYAATGAVVNCSFVSNKYDRLGWHEANRPLTFVNSLFCGRKVREWNRDDDISATDDGPSAGDSYSNCYFKTRWTVAGANNLNVATDPALAGQLRLMTAKRDPAHPYAPRRQSVLNGAGVVQDWMSGAVDLAGQDRLTNGGVAIGAYETTDRGPFPGLLLLFR